MPTVIDELLVTLKIDKSQFDSGAAATEANTKRLAQNIINTLSAVETAAERTSKSTAATAEAAASKSTDSVAKTAQAVERSSKFIQEGFNKAGETVTKLRNNFLGLLGITSLSVAGLERLFQSISTGTATMGRQAAAIGMSTNELGAWQSAVRSVGGTSEEATQAIGSLSQAFEDWKLTGVPPEVIGVWRQLVPNITAATDKTEAFLEASDKLSHMTMPEAQAWGRAVGISPDMINLMHQGRAALEALLDARRKLAPSDADATKFQALQTQANLLYDTIWKMGETIAAHLSPQITEVINKMIAWANSKEGIQQVTDVILTFIDDVVAVAKYINEIVQGMGGWEQALKDVAVAWAAWKALNIAASLWGIVSALTGITGGLAAIPALAGLAASAFVALAATYAGNKMQQGEIQDAAKKFGLTMHQPGVWESMQRARTMGLSAGGEAYFTDAQGNEHTWKEVMGTIGVNPDTGMRMPGFNPAFNQPPSALIPSAPGVPAPAAPGPEGPQAANPAELRAKIASTLNISSEDAAAIMSNMHAESGLQSGINEKNPTIPGSRGGWGLAQWTGPRRVALEEFAARNRMNVGSEDTQLAFMKEELQKYPGLLDRLKAARTPQEKAAVWFRGYESGGDPGLEAVLPQHIAMAQQYTNLPTVAAPAATAPAPVAPLIMSTQRPSLNMTGFGGASAMPDFGAAALAPNRGAAGPDNRSTDNSNTVTTGDIHIHTSATDADGTGKAFGDAIKKYSYVRQANAGLA